MRRAWIWVGAIAAAGAAGAHDLWIEPSTYRPQVGTTLALRLRVGQDFLGDAVPADPAGIAEFVLRGPRADTKIVTPAGAEPAGSVRVPGGGLYAVGYRSRPSLVSEDARSFDDFLRAAGLDDLLAARGASARARVRQTFARHAKSLLRSGAPAASGRERAFGFRLELVAGRDPYSLRPGATLPVRLLFEGKPLTGALVTAVPKAAPDEQVGMRTDANGSAALPLARSGAWLVRAARVLPAAAPPAEWDVLWASLTFELPPAVTPGK